MTDAEKYWKNNPDEIWKDIPEYEGVYQISNMGRVFSFPRSGCYGGILSPHADKDGYLDITLQKNGKKRKFRVHRLVALAFIPNDAPMEKPLVNHKNFIRDDNRVENLEWVSTRQNRSYRKTK